MYFNNIYFDFGLKKRSLNNFEEILLGKIWRKKILTAYTDLSWGLHWRAVAIVGITRNFIHISRDIVNNGHHVSRRLLSHQSSRYVQWYGGWWSTHGDAQHCHTAAFHYQIYWMNCRRLFVEIIRKNTCY